MERRTREVLYEKFRMENARANKDTIRLGWFQLIWTTDKIMTAKLPKFTTWEGERADSIRLHRGGVLTSTRYFFGKVRSVSIGVSSCALVSGEIIPMSALPGDVYSIEFDADRTYPASNQRGRSFGLYRQGNLHSVGAWSPITIQYWAPCPAVSRT